MHPAAMQVAIYLGLPDFVGLNVALPKENHMKLLGVRRLVLATYN